MQNTKFVGPAFYFNNEGIFKGFDCFKMYDTISFSMSERFILPNHTFIRLVIHFYRRQTNHDGIVLK